MSDSSGMSLGLKVGIVIGCLLAVTFVAIGLKLFLTKRRLDQKRIEDANRPVDREKLAKKKTNEGNVFGVRAIQHGHYGGAAQRPSSPSPSYLLAPEAQLIDWSKSGSSASSISSFARTPTKSSPLRLEVDPKYNAASVGGIGGSYIPPSPSVRSNRMGSPLFNEPKPSGWVSPLDVHFSRPNTAGDSTPRPTSYLPRLNLDFGKTGMLMAPSNDAKSEAASIASSEVPTPASAVSKSPMHSVFASQPSSVRAAQKSLRSVVPTEEQPHGLGSPKGSRFDSPPVPLKDLSPKMSATDSGSFPQDNRQWNPASPSIPRDLIKDRAWKTSPTYGNADFPMTDRRGIGYPNTGESKMQPIWTPTSPIVPDSMLDADWDRSRAIIRDSAVSKQHVSVVRPTTSSQTPQYSVSREQRRFQSQRESVAASSLYSNETSILDFDHRSRQERFQPQTADFGFFHNPSPGAIRRASPPRSVNGNRTSFRHSRSVSDESIIHPGRNGSASKPFDLESPFSNSHATSDNSHSANSSFSSYLSTIEVPAIPSYLEKVQPSLPDLENFPFPASTRPLVPRGFDLSLLPSPADHLQVAYNNRGRSTSEVSHASIGDFYDSYYRQSGITEGHESMRQSVQAQVKGLNLRTATAGKVPMREPPRRPAPLNLSKLGQRFVGNETIVEVATPNTGAFGPVSNERFPSRI